jgi:subtilisin family serine protease
VAGGKLLNDPLLPNHWYLPRVNGHGTRVAGVAAALGNDAAGSTGLAGRSKTLPVRIAFKTSQGGTYAYWSTVAEGLYWAAEVGARVANVSYENMADSNTVLAAAQYMKNPSSSSGCPGTAPTACTR